MRKYLIAGNWKMNLLRDSSVALIHGLADQLSESTNVEVAVCPPSVYLHDVGAALRGTSIGLGAQNMHAAESGAFTGEISGSMLTDLGCQYVILGHSERRQLFGETDAGVNEKTKVAFEHKLIPIVCVGETLEQREAGTTAQVVETQVRGSLADLTNEQAAKVVVAYEPVWAIGTGKTASPEQAEEVHAQIRGLLADMFDQTVADSIRIQYGGSVKPDNAAELLGQKNIDGALVGGASLKADGFAAIIAAVA
ncbi:MAG: triose-phosphate isomerase [Pirellulaceae bacterium]